MDNAGAPTPTTAPSGTDSDFPVSVAAESMYTNDLQPKLASYPPYSQATPGPPSVADTIKAGHKIRVQHKAVIKKPAKPFPRPARPWGPKATDVKMTAAQTRRHLACMRRHGAILTDRLERMSKPKRRTIIYFWREKADILPADTIARLRAMLDADEPFKPDQAYEYFINLRKTKKKVATMRGVNKAKKDLIAVCAGKKFTWARNATVAFARGIQQRLARPGKYALAEQMLRLSNIVLEDLCDYMDFNVPSRRCTHPKAKFMIELSDKIAVWIDEILSESEDRMLMMDFDEDADVLGAGDDDFNDDFLNMMGGGGGNFEGPERGPTFKLLLRELKKHGESEFTPEMPHFASRFAASYALETSPALNALPPDPKTKTRFQNALHVAVDAETPTALKPQMTATIDKCSDYLSGLNRDRDKALDLLVRTMKQKGETELCKRNNYSLSYNKAAKEIVESPLLAAYLPVKDIANEIKGKLHEELDPITPPDLKMPIKIAVNDAANLLSQDVALNSGIAGERYPIDLLSSVKKSMGTQPLVQHKKLGQTFADAAGHIDRAGVLSSNPKSTHELSSKIKAKVESAVPTRVSPGMTSNLKGAIDDTAKHIAKIADERGDALTHLVKSMKEKSKETLGNLQGYQQTYKDGARRIENAGTLTTEKMDKAAYETVVKKLDTLNKEKPYNDPNIQTQIMPGVVEDAAKFLAAPKAETLAEKRRVLADIVGQKEEEALWKEDNYQLSHAQAAKEILKTPEGKKEAKNTTKQKQMEEKLASVVQDKRLLESLREPITEGAAHLTDIVDAKGSGGPRGGAMGSDTRPVLGPESKSVLGPDSKLVLGPNGEKIAVGPDGVQYYTGADGKLVHVGSDGKPLTEGKPKLGADGKPMFAGPDGKPVYVGSDGKLTGAENPLLGANGKPLLGSNGQKIMIGPDRASSSIGADGKPVYVGVDGKPLTEGKPMLGADGKPLLGPNGERILVGADGKPYNVGANGKPVYVESDGKNIGAIKSLLRPNDNPLVGSNDENINIDPDGKSYYIGADGKPAYVGSDGKPLTEGKPMLGADGNPMSGPNGERILVGADGKSYYIGANGKPVYVGADGKPVQVRVADGTTLGSDRPLIGPDGTPASSTLRADNKPMLGRDGKPSNTTLGADRPMLGPDGKPLVGPNGKPMLVNSDGKAFYVGADGKKILVGPDGKSILGADGKPVYVGGGDSEGRKRPARSGGRGKGSQDQELARATELLHRALRLKGAEVFYEQPTTQLTHEQALECLLREETKLERSIRGSADTRRLAKKFEKKLNTLVDKSTPSYLKDVMQDVVIEAAAKLAVIFVTKAYKEVAKEGLIQEMQRQGNKILIDIDGLVETFFFAAQRLKTEDFPEEVEVSNPHVAHYLSTQLDDAVKCRTMPRKLYGATKDVTREVANFLSNFVTKPDPRIEAYVALLDEMEGLGDNLLINQKSYKDAAAFLKKLTSFKDQINKPNPILDTEIQNKLRSIMANVQQKGYTASDLSGIISEVSPLLVSHIVLEGQKAQVLNGIIEEMKKTGDNVLLRHGIVRKSYNDGVEVLKGKTTDQMVVQQVDPIVARKILTKLNTVMERKKSYDSDIMEDVIQCAADYLAVNLLVSKTFKVCQCMKNVFVQCELWTDEILRRVTKPCCSCSRHVSMQVLSELPSVNTRLVREGTNQMVGAGTEVNLRPCPAEAHTHRRSVPCPASEPQNTCPTNYQSYFMLGSAVAIHRTPPPMPPPPLGSSPSSSQNTDEFCTSISDFASDVVVHGSYASPNELSGSDSTPLSYHTPDNLTHREENVKYRWQEEMSLYSVLLEPAMSLAEPNKDTLSTPSTSEIPITDEQPRKSRGDQPMTRDLRHPAFTQSCQHLAFTSSNPNDLFRESETSTSNNSRNIPSGPTISTDQMSDWHAMIVSLMWNVQAWREWIQENVDTALNSDEPHLNNSLGWNEYQKRVAMEAIQWRQYNIFSQQLTMRLAIRYKDKQIVSPTRATIKTETYQECQQEMIKIIEMFNRWTHWLLVVVKETDSIKLPSESSDQFRWNHFKEKILTYADDWTKYNLHLKVCWEDKYRSIISEWLPSWQWSGPVWVVSACGAVPSGAVSGGVCDGEVIWVARTTHKNKVLPAALHPSKHCCIVYDQGSVHYYNKYQVMCNATVMWVRWRAGSVGARAVRVATGVHVGRVLYRGAHLIGAVLSPNCRCHVSIFDKHFAFSTYDLLVLAPDQN